MDGIRIETEKQNSPPRWASLLVLAALAVGGGLRSYWALTLPFNDAPDEAWHFPMVAYLHAEGRPPTMADVPARIPNSYPALPPVGYLPCVLTGLFRSVDDPDLYLWARLGNVLVGTMTIWIGFLATRRLAPGQPEIAVATAWILALFPQLVFLSAYVNPDATMVLGCTLLWYLWVRVARTGLSLGLAVAVGITAGVSVLSRLNALGVVLAGLPILIAQFWTGRESRRTVAMRCAVAGAVGLGACLPWFLWNWHNHHAIYGTVLHRTWWREFLTRLGSDPGLLTTGNFAEFSTKSWRSFWASFGYCTVWLDPHFYLLLTAATGLAAGVLLVRSPELRHRLGWAAGPGFAAMLSSMVLGTLLVVAASVYFSARYWLSPQGRYLLPAAWAVVTVLAAGHAMLGAGRWSARLGTFALVAFFGWMQMASIEVERRSNRFRQADRRVRTELLAHATALPGTTFLETAALSPVGGGRLTHRDGICRLHCDGEGDGVVRVVPSHAADVGWIVIEMRHEAGRAGGGSLQLVAEDFPGRSVAGIPFRQAGRGLFRYRFDVRKLTRSLGDRPLRVVFRPAAGPSTVVVRRFEIQNRRHDALASTNRIATRRYE